MILDTQTKFSDAQAITATAISTNVLDLRQATTPAAADEGLNGLNEAWLHVVVPQAFNTLTSLTITLESSAAVGLTSATVHYSASVVLASLTLGATVVRVPLPSGDYLRYVGMRYTVVGSNPTLGTVSAFISGGTDRNKIYPNGFAVT